MTVPRCQGNPTFNEVYGGAYSEWPDHVPGYICKTPPVGRGRAARFAQCCSGRLYNITHFTDPSDPAYPVSCAAFCQVDPKVDETNKKYPYGWSEHFMCLTNGGEEPSNWEVVCGTNVVSGMSFPTSYESTIKGPWQTKSYYRPSNSPDWVTVDPNSPTTELATTTSSRNSLDSTSSTRDHSSTQFSAPLRVSSASSATTGLETTGTVLQTSQGTSATSATTGTPSARGSASKSAISKGFVLVTALMLSTTMYL